MDLSSGCLYWRAYTGTRPIFHSQLPRHIASRLDRPRHVASRPMLFIRCKSYSRVSPQTCSGCKQLNSLRIDNRFSYPVPWLIRPARRHGYRVSIDFPARTPSPCRQANCWHMIHRQFCWLVGRLRGWQGIVGAIIGHCAHTAMLKYSTGNT